MLKIFNAIHPDSYRSPDEMAQSIIAYGRKNLSLEKSVDQKDKQHPEKNSNSGKQVSLKSRCEVSTSSRFVNLAHDMPDLAALRQMAPLVAKATEDFLACLKEIYTELSKEADEARLLGVAKAAQFLDISHDSIFRYIKEGALEPRWQGRRPYFPLAELTRYIKALPRKAAGKKTSK